MLFKLEYLSCCDILLSPVPSVPVGLEATDINSSALLVTWQPPLFPNGNITKYILTYNLSSHSPWKRDLKWCNREVFSNRHAADKTIDDGNADKNPNGKSIEIPLLVVGQASPPWPTQVLCSPGHPQLHIPLVFTFHHLFCTHHSSHF